MISRSQQLRLGLFFVVIVAAFGAFALAVAGQDLWQQFDAYRIRYTDTSVSGLQVGGTVIYQGIAVGSVEAIEIDPQNVENIIVTIRVEEGTPIKEDVRAQIVPVGITGISQIELSGGTQQAAQLEPNSFIEPAPSTMTEVTETARSVLTGIESLLQDISSVLSTANMNNVTGILTDVEGLIAENRARVGRTITNLESATETLSRSATESEVLLAELREGVAQLRLERVGADLEEVTDRAQSIVGDVRLLIRRNSGDVERSIESLNETMRMLNNFAFQINEDPSLLVLPQGGR